MGVTDKHPDRQSQLLTIMTPRLGAEINNTSVTTLTTDHTYLQ